jgi:MipA family protein
MRQLKLIHFGRLLIKSSLNFVWGGLLLGPLFANAQSELSERLVGNIGGSVYKIQSAVRGVNDRTEVLPFAYFDYGRFFARDDTFGVKVTSLYDGYLEVVGRASFEGFRTTSTNLTGIKKRSDPLPLGIGTFQETPMGGIFLYAFHDMSSSGSLLEATYAAALDFRGGTVYPQIGVEHRSMRYVRHLYGITPAESGLSGYSKYVPGSSTTPFLCLALDVPINIVWALNVQWRREWFDASISKSPLVGRSRQNSILLALSHSFK